MSKKNTLHLQISDQSMARLNALKSKTQADTYAEIIANALQLYDGMIQLAEAQNTFLMKSANGTVTDLEVFKP
jgi:hypothetical protein